MVFPLFSLIFKYKKTDFQKSTQHGAHAAQKVHKVLCTNTIKVVEIVLAVQIPITRVHTHMAGSCNARTDLSWSKWSKVFNLCTECFSNRAHPDKVVLADV